MAFVTSTVVQKSESPFNLFGGGETQRQGLATGSGIVIDANGTILTNYHVIENAIKVTVSFEKGQTVEAQVVGKDPSNDLAVLRIPTDGLTLHPLALGDSSAAQVGDPVYAIGNPFDLNARSRPASSRRCSERSPRPTDSRSTTCCRPTRRSTPATPAGRCSTRVGRVIGINSQIETGGSGNGSVGIGFAVPINTAKSEIAQLEKGGTVRGAYLGLTSLTVDGSLSALNLPVKSGALVQSVQKGTRRRKGWHSRRHRQATENGAGRGRRRHHRLARRQAVDSSEDLANAIGSKKPGRPITIGLKRANGAASTKTRP